MTSRTSRRKQSSVSRSRLTFEHLEARYVLNGQAILAFDTFEFEQTGQPTSLDVLANDNFQASYVGDRRISAASAASSGGVVAIAADGHSLLYKARDGFVGWESFTYTVDGTQEANVDVFVNGYEQGELQSFESTEQYANFLIADALRRYGWSFGQEAWMNGPILWYGGFRFFTANDSDLVATNVQVAGIDEGDLVEFDNRYLYALNGSELVIVDGESPDDLSVAARVDVDGTPIAQFLHGNRLTVISQANGGTDGLRLGSSRLVVDDHYGYYGDDASTIVTVIDVTDRTAPTIVQETELDGRYVASRAVGGFVYVTLNNTAALDGPLVIDEDSNPETSNRYETREEYIARVRADIGLVVEQALPHYVSRGPDDELVRQGLMHMPEDIIQPYSPEAMCLTSVVSFNVESNEPGIVDSAAAHSAPAENTYASENGIYTFGSTYGPSSGVQNFTRVLKFDWNTSTGDVEFAATGEAPGSILNQFSVDEHEGNLRLATNGFNNSTNTRENMVFVLSQVGDQFEIEGSLRNLAPGEQIKSVRFLGDRAFVVTFRVVDPLFAIDLSNGTDPVVLGELTIPGFSSYLHPLDDNHLLAIGENGSTEISIFNVSDMTNPQRVAVYTYSEWAFSEAQYNHLAFNYNAELGILTVPVGGANYYEYLDLDGDGIQETVRHHQESRLDVFRVDPGAANVDERLVFAGAIEQDSPVRRSGYIDGKLYSISNGSVKVVDVGDPAMVLDEISIAAPSTEAIAYPHEFPLFIDIDFIDVWRTPAILQPSQPFPPEPLAIATEQAREDLATRLGLAGGEPLLVSTEATPASPDGGHALVFRVGAELYLYRAGDNGAIELVQSDFEFSTSAAAWHSVFATAPQTPVTEESGALSETAPLQQLSVETPNTSYFTELRATVVEAGNQLRYRPAIRQHLGDASEFGLLLVALHGADEVNSGDDHWYDSSADWNLDVAASEFVFADLDDAFESLTVF